MVRAEGTMWTGLVLAERYELRAWIGRGGSGDVYEAVDRLLHRTVAVKLLHGGLDARLAVRVRREARAVARLAHPSIVAVHDVGEAHGRAFLVMEFVAGRSLAAELAASGPLPAQRAAEVAAAIAEALGHAHERDVSHRDVSPANVMLTPGGSVKLLDFGVAREAGDAEPPSWATLAYAAPEQRRGEPSGPGADVYAVGAILVTMLTGRPPSGSHESAEITEPLLSIARTCLDERPGHRFIDGRPLAAALRRAVQTLGDVETAPVPSAAPTVPAFPVRTTPLWPAPPTSLPSPTVPLPRIPPPRLRGRRRFLLGGLLSLVAGSGAVIVIPALISSFSASFGPSPPKPEPALPAPVGLAAVGSCDGWFKTAVTLSWIPTGTVDGYVVLRAPADGSEPWRSVARTEPTTASFRDGGLEANAGYRYSVRAVRGSSRSPASEPALGDTPVLCLG